MALTPGELDTYLGVFIDNELHGFDYDTFDACLGVRRLATRGDDEAWHLVHALILAAPDVYTRATMAVELLEPFVDQSKLPDLNARLRAAALADDRFREALLCVWGLPLEIEAWLASLQPMPPPGPLLRELYPGLIDPLRTCLPAIERLRVHGEDEAPGYRVIHTVPKRSRRWRDERTLHVGAGDTVLAINVCGEIVISIEIAD